MPTAQIDRRMFLCRMQSTPKAEIKRSSVNVLNNVPDFHPTVGGVRQGKEDHHEAAIYSFLICPIASPATASLRLECGRSSPLI